VNVHFYCNDSETAEGIRQLTIMNQLLLLAVKHVDSSLSITQTRWDGAFQVF